MASELQIKFEQRKSSTNGVTISNNNAKKSFTVGEVQDSKEFKKCLESKSYNVNACCKDSPPWLKWFPIHVAASSSFKSLELLLNVGVDNINQVTADKKTALHIACAYGNWEGVKLLIANGCDIMIQNNEGFVAYDFIVEPEKSPQEVVELVKPKLHR